jgi:hypothetical protein
MTVTEAKEFKEFCKLLLTYTPPTIAHINQLRTIEILNEKIKELDLFINSKKPKARSYRKEGN